MKKLLTLLMTMVIASCSKTPTETIPTLQFGQNPISAEEGSQHISVTAVVDWTITVTEGASWLSLNRAGGSPANGDVRISYSENISSARTAVITVKAGSKSADFKFTQNGKDSPGQSGGSNPSGNVQVGTDDATMVSSYTARISGRYSDAPSTPREAGFEWGTSASSLDRTVQSQTVLGSTQGIFTVELDNLSDGVTYYYRSYIVLMQNNQAEYIYGPVVSFSTTAAGVSGQAGWFELPLMNISKVGSYMVNASNASEYYAYHLCAGPEKNPYGKTARNYTVCYSADKHCPVWIAAPRHSMYVGSAGRSEAYGKDDKIPSNIQYNSKETGGGCNKGHMLGSAERTSSSASNRQVFYYTNIAPQLSSGFNTGSGGWNLLEDWVDTKVCSDTLYEVVGCYFDKFTDGYGKTASPKTISFGGRNDVSQPTMFYYALLRTKKGNSGKAVTQCSADELQCVAMVRTHTNDLKGQKVTSKEMISISDLEKITGVTFFANVKNAPKDTFKASDWGL